MNKHNGSTYNQNHFQFARVSPREQRSLPFGRRSSVWSGNSIFAGVVWLLAWLLSVATIIWGGG